MLYNERHYFESTLKLIPKLASVLNINCCYLTVVDCLKVAPRKIQHDSCS